jgi:hypothetical protein
MRKDPALARLMVEADAAMSRAQKRGLRDTAGFPEYREKFLQKERLKARDRWSLEIEKLDNWLHSAFRQISDRVSVELGA